MNKFVSAAKHFLRTWCRHMTAAYDSWERRSFPHGDGI
jgi:hypothetical protein